MGGFLAPLSLGNRLLWTNMYLSIVMACLNVSGRVVYVGWGKH